MPTSLKSVCDISATWSIVSTRSATRVSNQTLMLLFSSSTVRFNNDRRSCTLLSNSTILRIDACHVASCGSNDFNLSANSDPTHPPLTSSSDTSRLRWNNRLFALFRAGSC